jgi:hypothetical protein
MLHLLKTLLNDTITTFAPYSMRSKFPAAYVQAIKYQTSNMNATRVVVLQNISEAMMFYLRPYLNAIPGVRDLLASPKVDDNGRHTVLVDQAAFKSVRNVISKNLEGWINEHVSIDALPKDEQFAGSARVKPIYDDGMSSGENTWMSASNASFLSMDLSTVRDHSFFNEATNIEHVFTYADITVPNHGTLAKDDTTTDVASELTEMETRQKQKLEWLAESHRIATEKSDKLVEEQRIEIEQLKAQRQEDLEYRAQEQRMAEETFKAQSDVTSELRNETKAELNDLKVQMSEMMATLKAAFQSKKSEITPGDNKGPASQDDNNTNGNSKSDEKRRDVRSTPGKKLFTDEMDLEHSALSQQKLIDDATTTPMKE